MTTHYQLGSLFVIRVAGGSFERLERLATPRSIAESRAAVALHETLRAAAADALAALRGVDVPPGPELENTRRCLGQLLDLPPGTALRNPALQVYEECWQRLQAAERALSQQLASERAESHRYLQEDASTLLDRFSTFAASLEVQARIREASDDAASGRSGLRTPRRARMLVSYLQRACAKNDTVSEFGPTGWGRVAPDAPEQRGLQLAPRPGIAARTVYLEKWVIQALAEAMNADPAVKRELAPRLHPNGRIDGDRFYRADLMTERPLSPDEQELLGRIDGHTVPQALPGSLELLARLEQDGVILWQLEPPVLKEDRIEYLLTAIRGFADPVTRQRWLDGVTELARLPAHFAATPDPPERQRLMARVHELLSQVGRQAKPRDRRLYMAANPIGEDCVRDCNFVIGEAPCKELLADAEPWFQLFGRSASFVAHCVEERLQALFRSTPQRHGRVLLPAFFAQARRAGLALEQDGLCKLGEPAFARIQREFAQTFASRAQQSELQLTAADCDAVLARLGPLPPRPPVYPSVDLQLAAASVEAIARGEYEWVVAEMATLCPIAAHLFYWACPDRPTLSRDLRRMIGQPRICHTSLGMLDRAIHVMYHWPEVLADSWTCAAPERVPSSVRQVAPAQVELYLSDGASGDGLLHLRRSDTGEELGLFLNDWDLQFGMSLHPFFFPGEHHMPRLVRGRTILQRRFFRITAAELPAHALRSGGSALMRAIDELRAHRDLPRHIFARPDSAALARTALTGRDKDVKPFYFDLESYLFQEELARRLLKYGRLEVTEMRPSPEQLLWREADGRHTFEMRALLVPAEQPTRC